MAIVAQKLPVASVSRIIVVVMVFVVDREFPQALPFEFPPAAAADMRKHFKSLFAIALHALFLLAPGIGYKPVPAVIIRLVSI